MVLLSGSGDPFKILLFLAAVAIACLLTLGSIGYILVYALFPKFRESKRRSDFLIVAILVAWIGLTALLFLD